MSSRIRQALDILMRGRSDSTQQTGGARSDAQYRLPGELESDATGKQKPTTYVDYLVKQDVRDHANSEHRNLVAQYDPHANLWCYAIALNVWDDWFDFVDAAGNPLEEMDVVQEEFRRLRLKEELMHRATPEERKHGWSLV